MSLEVAAFLDLSLQDPVQSDDVESERTAT
jgi:hypothetical protein